MTGNPTTSADSEWAPRKLTPTQARQEQRIYWSRKTPAERIAASTTLTRQGYAMLGIDLDERKTDLTPRRIPRRPLGGAARIDE